MKDSMHCRMGMRFFFFFFLQNRETNTFTVGELLALRITEKRPVEIGLGPLPNTSIINPWGAD